ncbi:alpha/beta fold hydrolase [Tundrisphaera sp. TA3]|uniref:alpha/beta fold hydrolase n=1 Tax=Tundrisphaera sp. TA3 TaxID=3435775 RepID=UPI003EB86869
MAMRMGPRWLATLVLTVWVVPTFAGDERSTDVILDLEYANVGGRSLKLDLAQPSEEAGPFPAVVVIHGGAWRTGNKAHHRGLLADLARRGYVAISPQYRFCPQDRFPAQVHDVKAAVRWLRTHAEEYRIDPERIGAMGFSAGGHLSLMLGVTSPEDGLEGGVPPGAPSSRVAAVVNYFGPTDLLASRIPLTSRFLIRDFLGKLPDELPEMAAKASPVTFVTRDDPPMLTFHGTNDPIVPFDQATRLAAAMNRAGVKGRVELVVGAGHGWFGRENHRTMDVTFEFFDAHLKPQARRVEPPTGDAPRPDAVAGGSSGN